MIATPWQAVEGLLALARAAAALIDLAVRRGYDVRMLYPPLSTYWSCVMRISIQIQGLRWFEDSPSAGPTCRCSHCGQSIEDETPIRIFDDKSGLEARLHGGCFRARLQEVSDE